MKYIKALIAVAVLVLLDQWTKWLAVKHLMVDGPISIIEGVFELHYLENNGAAFGIFQNRKMFFVITTIIVLVALVFFYIKLPETKHMLPLRLISIGIAAGAIGNLIDRVWHTYVIDFFYFKLIDFPIFNVADIYVTVAAIMFLILGLFYYKEEDYSFLSKTKE